MTSVGASETRPGSSPSTPPGPGAFAPGTMLGDRYRIVALAGRGAMGEVYRAEDLRLGQAVALKFLPARLERDAGARERLLAEVRSARTVSHPNICRVYDVGEVQGRFFLTMEYIDGEDLASLLRRIGRLPADKVLEVARQLCAGLAAAHDKGVLHRDLKPANVMIDGRGQARITDFGLAVETGRVVSPADFAGTVGYLAPERFRGIQATVQSDLYALGLILYEACTGKPAFKATTVGDWQRAHAESIPVSPSAIVSDVDPAVERAIALCLEKDPARRPASAAQVAAALPGGDPLAAAVAAGETPSPALVAASGQEGTLTRVRAWLRLVGCAACFATAMFFWSSWSLAARIALPHPELQRERARQILRDLGYTEPAADVAWWIRRNTAYLEHFRDTASGGRALDIALANPAAVLFCYRQGPAELLTVRGRVSADDPAPSQPADAYLELGTNGRLIDLRVVPPASGAAPPTSDPFDWSPLLAAAGLGPAELTPVEPAWGPIYAFDRRAAWEGFVGNERVRAEAAARHGRPTYFRLAPTWMTPAPAGDIAAAARRAWPLLAWLSAILILGGIAFLSVLAVRNLRLGRGDRRSAFRLSLVLAAVAVCGAALGRHWVSESAGPQPMSGSVVITQIVMTFGQPLFLGLSTWLAYLGFEPHVRRRWPHLLVASTRLLDGRWRDPLVGRSLLAGVLAGIATVTLLLASLSAFREMGWGVVIPGSAPVTVYDLRSYAWYITTVAPIYVLFALIYLAVLLLAHLTLRGALAAWMGVLAVFFAMYFAWGRVYLGPERVVLVTTAVVLSASSVFVLWSNGLLALMAYLVVVLLVRDTPWTFALTRWYAWPTWCATVLIGGLAFWGFRNVLGRQSAFPAESLDR